ncbi:hypothetical protein [Nocardia pseudovaccinii]|uniref:hypothetical protein n=1 Tax=Nocardia pseudovaccinii TaxID=189540 RepID=UPI0012F4E6A4|nr:hypothetical protein [Nocardia pseudovaccinii]
MVGPRAFCAGGASAAFVPDLIVLGGLFFLALLILDREALETEPGEVSIFEH